jgi:type I restriction enzyme S subunit
LLITEPLLSRFSGAVMPASFCKLVRPNPDHVNSAYLRFFLQQLYETREIVQFQVQSTGISNFQFESFLDGQLIDLPPLSIQRKVVAILSAYDDLIGNNNRRIRILEEMAQRIYHEWFVDFRYPGNEGLPLVDSELGLIPPGWSVASLSDLVTTQYGYTESASSAPVGPRFLRGMDINKTTYIDWASVPYCPIPAKERPRYALEVGDIVVVRMADPGKVGIVEVPTDAVFASYLVRLRPTGTGDLAPYYFFYHLSSDAYQAFARGATSGATRGSLSAKVMTSVRLVMPPATLQRTFADAVTPMRTLIQSLLGTNAALRGSLHLLLPRLISGEVDVDDLDIPTGGAVP